MQRRYSVALVVLFIAVNAAAYAYLRNRMANPPEGESIRSVTLPTSPATEEANPISGLVFLAGEPDGGVLRVTRGNCAEEQPATAWVAPPGAAPAVVPTAGLVQTLAVGRDDDRWWVIGTDESCSVLAWTARLDGTGWQETGLPEGAWYLDPVDRSRVITPGGPLSLDATCDATSVQAAGPDAYVVCEDGRAYTTTRAEREFRALQADSAVVALAVRDDDRTALLLRSQVCEANLQLLDAPGTESTSEHCFGNRRAGLGVAWVGRDVVAQVGFELMSNANGEWSGRG